ncbi:hypothetical protein WICPIJ_004039 [Wickerhamomyces pijperi]|uniref:DNA repair protein RAD4 n=1 Tax=Wickerhamomyces pijperi TaxID=599730 RepID=A0A9P8Q624_WICPI|nr:hypothetical protein WICPIJ_004039 [Wickerhamomyces pijperi]
MPRPPNKSSKGAQVPHGKAPTPLDPTSATYLSQLPPQFQHLLAQNVKHGDKSKTDKPLKRKKKKKATSGVLGDDKAPMNDEGQAIMNVRLHDEECKHVSSPKKPKAKSTGTPIKIPISNHTETIVISSDDDEIPSSNRSTSHSAKTEVQPEDDEFEEDDFDDFEDVDLDNYVPDLTKPIPNADSKKDGDVIVNFRSTSAKDEESDSTQAKKKASVIPKEEKQFRQDFHRILLTVMMTHGLIRNQWCNYQEIQAQLKAKVKVDSHRVEKLLMGETDIISKARTTTAQGIVTTPMKSRRFLDGLKILLTQWQKHYKISSLKGLYRYDWNEWPQTFTSKTKPVDFTRFKKSIIDKSRGDRDLGAQGFVILLRSYGIRARLCYSIQGGDCYDYKIRKKESDEANNSTVDQNEQETIPQRRILTLQDKIKQLRSAQAQRIKKPAVVKSPEMDLIYPVFWAEAWNPFVKRWITVSPHLLVTIEDITNKSQLEPPPTYHYNQLRYVLAYDNEGYVRDVTKRYAEKYYSKTRKKRITRDIQGEIWYDELLASISKPGRIKADEYEEDWFAQKAKREGMPDSIADFKSHPFYVLERDIRANEMLKKGTRPCGYIRTRGKNLSLSVYKREDLLTLKTARGWYQKGMVLKAGARPMKTKPKPPQQILNEDDELEERLYSEDQVELYIPPPISEDGIITKNSFGNLDVFAPTMIPTGGVLLQHPFITQAVKALGIDYAPAVTGFKFERGRRVKPQLTGVVVWEAFKEVCESVSEQLELEDQEKQRCERELRALRGWWVVLNKLRIKKRLEKRFGKVSEIEGGTVADSGDKQIQKEYEEYLKEIDFDGEDHYGDSNIQNYLSGFRNEDEDEENERSMSEREDTDDEMMSGYDAGGGGGGGFFPDPEVRTHKRTRYDHGEDSYGGAFEYTPDSTMGRRTRSSREKIRVNYDEYYDEQEQPSDHSEYEGAAGGFIVDYQDGEDRGNDSQKAKETHEDEQLSDVNSDGLTQEESNELNELDEYEDFFNQLEMDQDGEGDEPDHEAEESQIIVNNSEEEYDDEYNNGDLGGGFDLGDNSQEVPEISESPIEEVDRNEDHPILSFQQEKEKQESTHRDADDDDDDDDDDDFKPVDETFTTTGLPQEQEQQIETEDLSDKNSVDPSELKEPEDLTDDEEKDFKVLPESSPAPPKRTSSATPQPITIELPKLPSKSLNYDEDFEKEYERQLQMEEKQRSETPDLPVNQHDQYQDDDDDSNFENENQSYTEGEELQEEEDDDFEYDSD